MRMPIAMSSPLQLRLSVTALSQQNEAATTAMPPTSPRPPRKTPMRCLRRAISGHRSVSVCRHGDGEDAAAMPAPLRPRSVTWGVLG